MNEVRAVLDKLSGKNIIRILWTKLNNIIITDLLILFLIKTIFIKLLNVYFTNNINKSIKYNYWNCVSNIFLNS